MKLRINLELLIIIIIAVVLRLLFLSTNPNGLSVEEASAGYDAYSMMLTGRDRYGQFMPVFSRSFEDYDESISRFATIPFIAILGLNEFSTRLPIAIIGILTVIIVYYLAQELFNKNIAFLTGLLIAISPWHIQFSRIAFRGIFFPFWFCLGLLLFYQGFQKKYKLILSGVVFGLSLYTYGSARVFVPLFIAGLVIIYYKELSQNKKISFISGGVFLVILGIMVSLWLTPAGMARQEQVGLTFNPLKIIYNYISYFTPQFLFANGDPYLRHSPNKMGMLHIFEFISVTTGIFYLFQEKSKVSKVLFLWLILYPIPAALTKPVHALRGIIGSPLFAIISSYGIIKLAELIKLSQKQLTIVLAFIITLSLAGYSYRFFGDYPKESTKEWSYGMREAITYTEKQNSCIMISNNIGLAHVFVLFYSRYSPQEYQKSPIQPEVGIGKIGKYEIVNLSDKDKLNFNCIWMITPEELELIIKPKYQVENLDTVKNLQGEAILEFIKVKQ